MTAWLLKALMCGMNAEGSLKEAMPMEVKKWKG
jgi:hypothetical protein